MAGGLFQGTPISLLGGIIFTAILVMAAFGDLRTRRIPNRTVAILALLGIAYSAFRAPVLPGLEHAGGGIVAGLACWLPFYALGWLGAGDVKLFAAAGAWLGPARALDGAIVGALFGGVLSLIWMMRSHGVRNAVQTLGIAAGTPGVLSPASSGEGKRSKLPYGLAIAFGAIWAGWMPRLLNV